MASSDRFSNTTTTTTMEQLPLKPIPGSHGLPFFGPINDRHDYFYHQGRDKFFATKIKKYNSTIIRTNMPPGPFISFNSRVIALPDGASFPILFDTRKVEKCNVLDGSCPPPASSAATEFAHTSTPRNPTTPSLSTYIEDFLIRTVPFPGCLAKLSYKKLYEAFSVTAETVLDQAEKLGIKRSEACHNLVFMAGFNAYSGLKNQFPILIKWVSLGGVSLHKELANEIRSVVKEQGGVTLGALEKMSLVKSIVYEVMRMVLQNCEYGMIP